MIETCIPFQGFLNSSVSKESTCNTEDPEIQEIWVRSLGQEDLLQKEIATQSSILAWKIPRTEEPGELQSKGLQRVGHDLAHTSIPFQVTNRKRGMGLPGVGGKLWEGKGKNCVVSKGCLVIQGRFSQEISVVSRSSTLPGIETDLQMEIYFTNVNFLYKRENLCFIFQAVSGR